MEPKRGFTMHWGILLIVYLAILFATSMVVLTTGSANGYFVLLLATGVPVYVIASRAIMSDQEGVQYLGEEGRSEGIGSNVVAFPTHRPTAIPADVIRTAAESRRTDLRKLG
jgi:hypothetical protein